MKTETQKNTRALVESSVLIAIATILSLFKLYEMPWGGSVTLASMLPLIIIAYRHGLRYGLISSLAYSLLQMLLGFSTISAAFLPGDDQMVFYKAVLMVLLDYVFAFSLVGLSALFMKKSLSASRSLTIGAVFGCGCRFVMHFLSGYILWGSWAAGFFEDLDKLTGGTFGSSVVQNLSGEGLAAFYSLFYNGAYMLPEMIITALLAFFIGRLPQIDR